MQSWDYNFFYQGGLATKTKTTKDNHTVSGLKKQLPKLIHGGKKKKKSRGSICQYLHVASQELRKQPAEGWVDRPSA